MNKTMNRKNIGFGILLMTLMLCLTPIVSAYPSTPTDDDFKEAAIKYMISHHPELEAVDSEDWEFTLIGFTTSRFKVKLTYAGGPDTYKLNWIGLITWNAWSDYIRITELYYRYEVDITVSKVGPGTTNPTPGVYHVKGGSAYSFSAIAAKSEYPEEYNFRFVKWTINDGESVTEEYGIFCSGTASTDLTITAIFETSYMSYCLVIHEDGLSQGYMWRDDHVLLAMRIVGLSSVTITIESDYGIYNRTVRTGARSFCIYFTAQRFEGDYTVSVTATNIITEATYNPRYMLAGLD